ncbi:Glycosyltransferase involved in cell wall bisynthesis [Alkalibacterium gilvum]|uniref:Glycosyltransferase involved in cell wall bisynthesis n=1 Tax=Alkalibacterium gilvum TaxID=1130080 RepID=A0A1H6TB08_9LACT|nr:glycosyltransferase family 4 protein [Alkalibacterium gilvum]SEI77181.1 Glycosyltransferase involved in cell wall bisynthesis [Alkalibacterium gilvum]
MKVCITRNDEADMNASVLRVATALSEVTDDICLLTRSRYNKENHITLKKLEIGHHTFDNYEMSIKGKPAGGLKNLFQLIQLEIKTFRWFISNRKKYDIIHAFDLDMGLPAMVTNFLFKKSYVYHIADFYVDSRNGLPGFIKPLVRKLEQGVINNADSVIICTQERKEQIKGSHPKQLSVIHNTPILSKKLEETIESTEESFNGKITFTYVGSLTKRRFIKEVVDVISKETRAELIIAGTGELADYVQAMSFKHQNIIYLGKVTYDEALDLYTKSDMMFAIYDPSIANHKYSAPNKVYEAMMTGNPIIVAKNTGIDSIVMENNMGFSIDYSKSAFENLLKEMIDGEQNLTLMGKNAKEAYPNYSWSEMKQRIKAIYSA